MKKNILRLLSLVLCAAMLLPLIPAATAITAEAKPIEATPTYDAEAQNQSAAVHPYQFSTFEELKELCTGTYEPDTFFNWSGNATEFVFTESLTIPENVSLQLVNIKVIIPKGVVLTESTDRWSKNISGGLVVHGVYNCGTNSLQVGKELTVTGSMNINTSIFMDKDTVVSGVENIHFASSDQKLCYSYSLFSDSELHTALAKASADSLGIEYRLSLIAQENVTFSKSFTIPSNMHLSITGGVTHTLPSGKSITVNGVLNTYAFGDSCPIIKIEGKLINNNVVKVQCNSGDTAMMIFTGTYSGQGTIEVGCAYYGVDFLWTDIITGLNPDNMDVKGGPPTYTIRDVSHLTRLSAPKNLTWNVNMETVIDDSGKGSLQLVTRMGSISWEAGEIRDPYFDGYFNNNYFVVNVYRDGEAVLSNYGNVGFSDYYEQKGFPICMDISSNIEWESGTYYFTVQAVPNPMATDSAYRSSVVATSEPWVYTKPANLATPTNPTWNWPTMNWTNPSGSTKHEIEIQYSPTQDGEYEWIDGWIMECTNEYTLNEYALQNYATYPGAGYYKFRIRSRSSDITVKYHSNWSTFSEPYYFDGKVEMLPPSLFSYLDASTGKIGLTWTTSANAVKYQIARSTDNKNWEHLTYSTSTFYIDTEATAGTYYYKVRALDADGNQTDYSNVVSQTISLSLPAPTLKASNVASTGKIKLTWNAVPGAAKYQIVRSLDNKNWEHLAYSTGTSATNTKTDAGKTYYYKIRAIDANGNKSKYSNVVSRTCDLPQPTLTATNVASTGKIKLSWNKIGGAAKYQIVRSLDNKNWEHLTYSTGTSATNTKADAGKTYYYKVRAIHSNSAATSAYSSVVSRTCDLPQPKVTASNVASTGKIKLSWNKVEGAAKYQIVRSLDNKNWEHLAYSTGTSATNTKTEAGKTYYYKVRAVHTNSDATSAYSAVVSRTCDLAQPTLTVKLNSNGKPTLSWTKVTGAMKYQIVRSTDNKNWEHLAYSTGTSATNTKAEVGIKYYYKIRAIHSNTDANSAYSAVKYITAK